MLIDIDNSAIPQLVSPENSQRNFDSNNSS